MSESFIYSAGLNNVGSFQVSGIPFVTGGINASTVTRVSFPYVTRWIQIANVGDGILQIGFSQNGVQGSRYFSVPPLQPAGMGNGMIAPFSPVYEIKATEIWITGSTSVDIIAGLTNIPTARIDNPANSPSGSNWSGSANV
jgi:hypothetical protein